PSSRKPGCSPCTRPGSLRDTPDEEQLPTGEPYAGKPPVRFGRRGGGHPFPTPITPASVLVKVPDQRRTTSRTHLRGSSTGPACARAAPRVAQSSASNGRQRTTGN